MSHVDRINLKVVHAVMMFLFIMIILLVPQASLGAAEGTPDFVAIINGQQIVNHDGSVGTASTAVATGHFWLNEAKTRLDYRLVIQGLDLDRLVRKNARGDDVTTIHLHQAPAGSNGPHVLNVYGLPCEDDHDLSVQPFQGLISGRWDDQDVTDLENCPSLTGKAGLQSRPLTSVLNALCAGNLYVNIHTTAFPKGEIRGQILSTSTSAACAGVPPDASDYRLAPGKSHSHHG